MTGLSEYASLASFRYTTGNCSAIALEGATLSSIAILFLGTLASPVMGFEASAPFGIVKHGAYNLPDG